MLQCIHIATILMLNFLANWSSIRSINYYVCTINVFNIVCIVLSYGNILVHDSVQMFHVDNSEPVDVTPLASFTVKLKDIFRGLHYK